MDHFQIHAPTQIIFGKNTENEAGKWCKYYGAHKVLVHFGGHSAKKSGLLDRVCASLKDAGLEYVLLGGVVPNPQLSMVKKGVELCREENVDFILAVGGGSVIDSAKGIGYGLANPGDVWDYYAKKKEITACAPLGAVLTIAAAGSEMSDATVITNEDGDLKKDYGSDKLRCKFAVMNPERTFTLPPYQTAAGVVDIIMHTLERYFSHDDDMTVTDSIAESLIRTVQDSAFKVLQQPDNYLHRAQIMWASSLSHNGLTGCGTTSDWATHFLEHELSGMFDVTHGAGLAAVWGSWARYVYLENPTRFAQFAVNAMGVRNNFKSAEETALAGIEALERFFRAIGMPTSIHELIGREITDEEIREMSRKCSYDGTHSIGGFKVLNREDMEHIYRAAR